MTLFFCTWQHSSDYKRNMLLDHLKKKKLQGEQQQEPGENIREKSRKFVGKWDREKCLSFRKKTIIVQGKLPFFLHNRELKRIRDIPPLLTHGFLSLLKGSSCTSFAFFTFLAMLSFSLGIIMLKLLFFITFELFH